VKPANASIQHELRGITKKLAVFFKKLANVRVSCASLIGCLLIATPVFSYMRW